MIQIQILKYSRQMARRIKEDVFRGILEFLYYFYASVVLILTARINLGKNIFEMDWDLLIILDACRVDAMIQIAPEYDFIQNVDVATSVGSSSDEWLAKTFNKKHADKIAKTSYITANPNFSMVIDERLAPPIHAPVPFRPSLNYYGTVSMDDFAHFDEVYKDSRGRREKVVLPSTLVERAIDAGRRSVAQKYVIHFMQPHVPYIGVPNPPSDPFQLYKNDNLSHSEIWDMYLDTLRLVLDEVQKLLNNFDA